MPVPSDSIQVARVMAAALNMVRSNGLVWREAGDNLRVLSEPGHFDGWHDVAAVEYNEAEDRWFVVGAGIRADHGATEEVLQEPWFAMVEDTIGGWCVMTTPDLPSAGKGAYIADFISGPKIAQHIADLHNCWLAQQASAAVDEAILARINTEGE
jgi:hypothetical protein